MKGRQARFVVGTVGTWAGGRAAMVWLGAGTAAGVVGGLVLGPHLAWPHAVMPHPFRPAHGERRPPPSLHRRVPEPSVAARIVPERDSWETASARPAQFLRLAVARIFPGSAQALLRHAVFQNGERGGDAAPLTSAGVAHPPGPSRWSGNAYLFVRPGSGRASLAAGGELGGSQAAARLAYRLNATGPVRTAVAARIYAPLAAKGAEAAVGLDWHPLPTVPLRLSVERRIDLDGHGRNAWSAYAAGGFYLERLDGRLALDGYVQTGVVGLGARDLFVDGALRAGRRYRLGALTATVGAGLWGAAQPGVSRLDMGPRIGLVLPVASHDLSLAVEGRLRVAGRASPGSGAAMTLGFDL